MIEYKAQTGGRYTYVEDLLNLQELAISITSIFSNVNNCVISGCEVTKLPSGNVNIAAGYVWLDGKIRKYIGTSDVSIANGYYICIKNTIESVKYANDASKAGREVFGTVGQQTAPSDNQYVFINPDGIYPTIEVELFGKYSVIKNPRSSLQTIHGSIAVVGDVNMKMLTATGTNIEFRTGGLTKSFKTEISDEGLLVRYLENSVTKTSIKHRSNDTIEFLIGESKVLTLSKDKCLFDILSANGSNIGHIQITGDNINLTGDASSSGSLKLNFKGYQGGNTVNRSVDIYNGKGSKLFSFIGSGTNESFVNLQISNDANLTLKNTIKSLAEDGFSKYLEIKDRTDSSLLKLGYWGTKTLKLDSNGNVMEVTVPSFKVSGDIFEKGESLSAKYATVQALSNLDGVVVKKDGNKVLTDVNFTQELYNKLNSINISDIGSGGEGFVTAASAKVEFDKKMDKTSNLSDLSDKAISRTNLDVYSKTETSNRFLNKNSNLSDVVDVPTARTNLDVYSKEEVDVLADSKISTATYNKSESDEKYQNKLKNTTWMNCTQGGGVGIFSVKAKQYGNVVSIQGTLQTAPNGSTWLTIPNEIDPPSNTIGGVADMSIRDVSGNYGLKWRCDAGSRNIKVAQQHGAHTAVDILITYII